MRSPLVARPPTQMARGRRVGVPATFDRHFKVVGSEQALLKSTRARTPGPIEIRLLLGRILPFVTLAQPRRAVRAPTTLGVKVAYVLLLLPLAGLVYAFVHLAGVHARSGEWAWTPSATPPKVPFGGVEYLRIRHPTFPDLPPGDAVVGKTPGGGVIYADPTYSDPQDLYVPTDSQDLYGPTDSHYAVYARPGGG
jgi:hypothetical protein